MKHRMLCERAQDSSGKARTIAGVAAETCQGVFATHGGLKFVSRFFQ
jgi:hypothetical protein